MVTSYRYFDDITVFATVDLGTGRVVEVQAAQHLRTALSEGEYEEAKAMARQRSEPVKELFEKFGDKLSVYPQFSQYTPKGDPRVHRVVHLTYRVGTKDLSYPRPMVDLTTREVVTRGDRPRKPWIAAIEPGGCGGGSDTTGQDAGTRSPGVFCPSHPLRNKGHRMLRSPARLLVVFLALAGVLMPSAASAQGFFRRTSR